MHTAEGWWCLRCRVALELGGEGGEARSGTTYVGKRRCSALACGDCPLFRSHEALQAELSGAHVVERCTPLVGVDCFVVLRSCTSWLRVFLFLFCEV